MTDDGAKLGSIPAEQWPDPVCRFVDVDGTPIVDSVNVAFEATFGTTFADEAVSDAFDALGLTVVSGPGPGALGSEGDRIVVETDGSTGDRTARDRYLVRSVAADDGTGTFLVFTSVPRTETGETRDRIDLDHVASVISHDLRNPLDVAKARLRAGRETGEDAHFEHVARAHERMERIVEDVLTLAGGTEVVEPDEPVDIGTVAEAAWETVGTDGADLVVERPLPTVVADPDRLGRLFENLFRNAVEHGGENVTVTVGTLRDDAGFFVADDGRGIGTERRDRIFEPGYSTVEHGTGLGLSIVSRIVALHGWTISVENAPAGGARFEIVTVDRPDGGRTSP